MLSKKLLQGYCFAKTIWMVGLFGIVLTCATINGAEAQTLCYCSLEAYTQDYIRSQAEEWGQVFPIPTCDRCRKLCQERVKVGFSWGACWGQTIKPSNCDGCGAGGSIGKRQTTRSR